MARLFTCGFEENNLTATMWTASNGSLTIVTTPVHSGTYALRVNPAAATGWGVVRDFSGAGFSSGTIFGRAYVRFASFPTAADVVFISNNNQGAGIMLELRVIDVAGNKRLRLRNAIAVTSTDGTINLLVNTWYRIEFRHLLSDTVGEMEIRLFEGDATTALETLSLTAQDTLHGDGLRRHEFSLLGTQTADVFFDDIALNDATQTFQTSWPGPGKIALAVPGGETAMGWEDETAGVSVYTNVNDLPGTPDDVNYNKEDDTLNVVDQMTLATLPVEITSDADMILIDVYARVGSSQAFATTGRLKVWDEANALTNGPNVSFAVNGWRILSGGPTIEHQVFDLDTRTKANAQNFALGYENITDDATRVRRVSALWANVEWIEAAADTLFAQALF